jgi:hypothetical protein
MKQKLGSLKRLARSTNPYPMAKWKRKKTHVNKISDEKWNINRNTNENRRLIREYFENLYSNKLENLDKSDKCLDAYNQTILNREDNNLNRPITNNEIEAVKRSLPTKKSPESDGFMLNFTKPLKRK